MKQGTLLSVCSFLLLTSIAQGGIFNGFKKKKDGRLDDVPSVSLSNNMEFPLIGLGVCNLETNLVENMVFEGLQAGNRIRLIDTAQGSANEKEVARGITAGVKRFKDTEKLNGPVQVHVITKIWYTHLGYERTKLSVKESLEDLSGAINDPNVDLKVHFLIHWPRCYDGIEWMNCEAEENNLPASVKEAGPSPLLDKQNAWKESWKALEDIYNSGDYPMVASLGVSNFGSEDMKQLIQMARVQPHLAQINVWSLLNDPSLIDLLNRHNIRIQVYNVMNGTLGRLLETPYAHHHLLKLVNEMRKSSPETLGDVKVAQVVLKWLVQHQISIIPKTSDLNRLAQNSAVALSGIPDLSESQSEIVARAIEAMLTGDDLEEDVHVKVTFHAKNQDMFLYFFPGPNEATEKQITYIEMGDSYEESTHPKHTFRIYNAYDPDVFHDYTVEGNYGEHHHVHVEL